MSPSDNKKGLEAAAQSDDEPDYTILSRRWSGVELITAEIALEIARRVHAHTYGAADLAANEPLTITEEGHNWVVAGAKPGPRIVPDQPLDLSRVEDFPFGMKISKFDGRILSYLLVLPVN